MSPKFPSKAIAITVFSLCLSFLFSACETARKTVGMESSAKVEKTEKVPLNVNGYLWRASLDTLNFMPLASADPIGGTIITDWYVDPEAPAERFKATVYILDTRLRADGLKVLLHREINQYGSWQSAPTASETGVLLENAILNRARELKIASLDN